MPILIQLQHYTIVHQNTSVCDNNKETPAIAVVSSNGEIWIGQADRNTFSGKWTEDVLRGSMSISRCLKI